MIQIRKGLEEAIARDQQRVSSLGSRIVFNDRLTRDDGMSEKGERAFLDAHIDMRLRG